MASRALGAWRLQRLPRVDALVAAHAASRPPGPGRVATRQLNGALVVALAAEFQGYARDLYDEVATFFAAAAARGNARLAAVLLRDLRERRELNRGNAHPGALGADFMRFGLDLWPAIAATDPRAAARNAHLTALNDARNAVAHARPAALTVLRLRGYPLTLATVRRWRSTADGVARTMDAVTSAHLAGLFGSAPPW